MFRSRRNRRHLRLQSPNVFLLSRLATYLFFATIGFVLLGVILFVWYGRDLPAPGKLVNAKTDESTHIYDRNGVLLYSVYKNENRTYVSLSKIPKYLQDATISVEDRNFYKNQGFSITGYLRAIRNIILLRPLSGGSTLTQQLVKNTLLSPERTIPRKIKELILSIQVDKKYSKNQILEMYLNDIPYGGTTVGVEAAAETYFGKSVSDLDLAESAFVAGLPQSPTVYSPFNGHKYYIDRTNEVLTRMVNDGYISQKQATDSLNEIKNTQFSQNDTNIKAPHFVMYVKSLLAKQFGEQMVDNGGLQVTTTLNWNIEKEAEQIVRDQISKLKIYNATNGAAVVTDPKTGEILSMVGSENYFDKANDGNFNAALAERQPGSSLKPIMYAVAFEKGYTPATMVMDVKTDFPTGDPAHPMYTPVNYDRKYHGPMQLRFALGNSINVIAVKMLARVGIKNVMEKAYEMGIDNWKPTPSNIADVGLSLVLGGRETTLLDETTAYGVFASAGYRHDPVAILKVTDRNGNVLYQYHPTQGQQVLPADICFLISHILLDNNARTMAFGPNSWLVIPGQTVSVKTGTTDDKRDNWTIGYNPSYVVGVWVGNNDNSPMNQAIASGETGASPIWHDIMSYILKGKPDEPPKKPNDVIAMQIDALGGGLPVPNEPVRSEYFIKGTEPTSPSPIYQKLKISTHDPSKLANQDEISHGDYTTKDYIVFHEDDPVSTDGVNRWQEGIDAWVKENYSAADWQYYPPTQVSNYKYNG